MTSSIHLADVYGDTVRTWDTAHGSVASGRRVACWRLLIRIQRVQIVKANSANATATRRRGGSSTPSS